MSDSFTAMLSRASWQMLYMWGLIRPDLSRSIVISMRWISGTFSSSGERIAVGFFCTNMQDKKIKCQFRLWFGRKLASSIIPFYFKIGENVRNEWQTGKNCPPNHCTACDFEEKHILDHIVMFYNKKWYKSIINSFFTACCVIFIANKQW